MKPVPAGACGSRGRISEGKMLIRLFGDRRAPRRIERSHGMRSPLSFPESYAHMHTAGKLHCRSDSIIRNSLGVIP
jgi:hypothetical protein